MFSIIKPGGFNQNDIINRLTTQNQISKLFFYQKSLYEVRMTIFDQNILQIVYE